MSSLGNSLSATLRYVPSETAHILRDACALEGTMRDVAQKAEMSIVSSAAHQFSPQGASCVLVLEESHFACHTWPEHGAVACSIHSCSKTSITQLRTAITALAEALKAPEHGMRFAFFAH